MEELIIILAKGGSEEEVGYEAVSPRAAKKSALSLERCLEIYNKIENFLYSKYRETRVVCSST